MLNESGYCFETELLQPKPRPVRPRKRPEPVYNPVPIWLYCLIRSPWYLLGVWLAFWAVYRTSYRPPEAVPSSSAPWMFAWQVLIENTSNAIGKGIGSVVFAVGYNAVLLFFLRLAYLSYYRYRRLFTLGEVTAGEITNRHTFGGHNSGLQFYE